MPWPTVSDDPYIQAHYCVCRDRGTPHGLAEMFAFQQPPMSKSDREMLQGHVNGSQFEKVPYVGDFYKEVARRAGVSTTGKVYLSQLANFPGDPRAWVSDRHDVQKVCEERDWSCDGMVSRKRVKDLTPPVEKDISDDIVNEEVASIMEESPGIAVKPVEVMDLKEKVRNKRKPHWSKT